MRSRFVCADAQIRRTARDETRCAITSEKKNRRYAATRRADAMSEPNEDMLRHWLLGQLPAGEAEGLERRLVEDEDFSLRLRDIENDLLDDFARERLSGDERAQAAAYFSAAPADRARLRIARALASVAGADSRARHPSRHGAVGDSRASHRGRRGRWAAAAIASACAVVIAVVGLRRHADVAPDAEALTITLMANHQDRKSVV